MTVEDLKQSFFNELPHVTDAKRLEELRVQYLGRERGLLTKILRSLKDLSDMEKRRVGPAANALRDEIESALAGKLKELQAVASVESDIDITRPGVKIKHGHLHPLTLVEEEVKRIFRSLNFSIVEGPEVESEYYNFDALNIPQNHPARDMWDTFWLRPRTYADKYADTRGKEVARINAETFPRPSALGPRKSASSPRESALLLRTHTSPMQVRFMETHTPPFQILVPGRVFRYEATDATHEINFMQYEGLMVGKNITVANFKYVIETFFTKFFGKKVQFRYRPSFFPFTEPSWEVDIHLPQISADTTQISADVHPRTSASHPRKSAWLEMMGAGMVHQKVFENVGYVPGEWQGFAFGMGDRIAMIKYGIPDVRLSYSGDLRFINQF